MRRTRLEKAVMKAGRPIWLLLAAGLAASQLAADAALAWSTLPSRQQDTPGFVYTASPADWRTKNIYQIVTDRFYNGDTSNDNSRGGFDPCNGQAVHGGDFKGVQFQLPYLKQLGVGAIWISPVMYNVNVDDNGNMPYHGYQPFDLNQIEPHFGSLQDLRNMIDAAHAQGISVVLDILVNNMADLISSKYGDNAVYNPAGFSDMWWWRGYTYPAPFDTLSRFHNNGAINNYSDPNQYIRGELTGGLDDITTEDPGTRQDLATIYQAVIAATDCDGFRVDAVKHVEAGFWDYFVPQIKSYAASLGKTNFLMYGEVFDSDDGFVGSYTGPTRFESMQDFPMQAAMQNVFVSGQNTSQFTDRYNALTNYDAPARAQLVNFLDNQDLPRILNSANLNDNWPALKVALVFLYTYPEIPCLYYGTEQGFDGGADPYNREDMFAGCWESGPSVGDNFNTGHVLFQWVQKLNDTRAWYPALTLGNFTQRWQNFSGAGIYAYTRQLGSNEALVVLNTSPAAQACYPAVAHPAGTVFINLLNNAETLTADAAQTLWVTNNGYTAKLFIPLGDLQLRWVGKTYNWPPTNQVSASQDFWINTDSWPQGAGVAAQAIYSTNGVTWVTTNMTYAGADATNDWWHVDLGRLPAGTAIQYGVAVTDRVGSNRWDTNGGAYYQAAVPAGPALTWIGNVWNYPANGQIRPIDDFWVNIQAYPQGAAAAGQVVFSTDNVTWFATNMTFDSTVGSNDSWHADLGNFPGGKTIQYAINIRDSRGTSLWANNGGTNYSATVNTQVPLAWIGNAFNWPFNGQIKSNTDFWVNIQSDPAHAGVSASVVYSTDGITWKSAALSQNGTAGNSDLWHADLGQFPSRTIIQYAISIMDGNGRTMWANNNGVNYRAGVQ